MNDASAIDAAYQALNALGGTATDRQEVADQIVRLLADERRRISLNHIGFLAMDSEIAERTRWSIVAAAFGGVWAAGIQIGTVPADRAVRLAAKAMWDQAEANGEVP